MSSPSPSTWTAPQQERVDPPLVGPEREALEGWLDYHRATLLWKCSGLTGEQLARRSVEPSTMSLLGLVRHMAEVERGWFRVLVAREAVGDIYPSDDESEGDWDHAQPAAAHVDFEIFAREVAAARAVVASRSLDETFLSRRQNTLSIRWLFLHMIEEYARHNGHADLLRERIDGATGD